jgi:hypothetical protein
MTKEEIIEMATQSGFSVTHNSNLGVELYLCNPKDIQRFAKLISEKEREECAKLCDYVYNNIVADDHIKNMAFKIRARGQE